MNISSIGIQTVLPTTATAQQPPPPPPSTEQAPKPQPAPVASGVGERVDRTT